MSKVKDLINDKKKAPKAAYCPKCGSKMKGSSCASCGAA